MTYKSPGVYVEEVSLFPPSVAEVETAIPAFMGYTVTAIKDGAKITEPLKISSLNDFEKYFGRAPKSNGLATVKVTEDPLILKDPAVPNVYNKHIGYKVEVVQSDKVSYSILYYAIQMFYDNGGGQCYIASVGEAKNENPKKDDFTAALEMIRNLDEPTILLAPEAVYFDEADHASFCQAMIKQATELKDRVVILDTLFTAKKPDINDDSKAFRAKVTGDKESLRYAASYYPWINTSVKYAYDLDEIAFKDSKILDNETLKDLAGKASDVKATNDQLYQQVKNELEKSLRVTLPPSSTIAGVYATVDNERGVWKAPANVVLKSVTSPAIQISQEQQRDLNVDPEGGKSINAIRTIPGKGVTVWGARTMDGNDKEWRYINVRRFFNMVEESVQKSTIWAVFEPNTKNTWVKVKGMIESYLLVKWIEGALAGSKPEEAFFVKVGLPETMSSDDILEGKMIVKIGLAVSRPAEFIILQFTHKQQTS
jgi:phage tail sheath protein FI